MTLTQRTQRAATWTAGALGLAAMTYAAYVGTAWSRYGHAAAPDADEIDPLLDQFMPEYEVAERHHVRVAAPPDVTLAAAAEADLQQSAAVRAIFKASSGDMFCRCP